MNTKQLVTFAFASKRRKLATLTVVGLTGIGALVGGGSDDKTPSKPAAVVTPATTPTTAAPAEAVPVASTIPAAPAEVAPVSTKCDGVHFNLSVEPGDKRDRDGDGIACEKN